MGRDETWSGMKGTKEEESVCVCVCLMKTDDRWPLIESRMSGQTRFPSVLNVFYIWIIHGVLMMSVFFFQTV